MGQKESSMTNYENDEMKLLKCTLDKEGPGATSVYLEKNMNRWKEETVLLAVSGCSATGKSTFINTFRGVERGNKGYAEVGFGDTTMEATPYVHPKNPRIIYYDLPGVGTLEMKKENYINSMKLCEYDFIFIFFDKVINEDNLWLVGELEKMGKPYCFVRSKLDQDIQNAEREKIGKELVLPMIRKKVEKSVEKNDKLKNSKKIFFISCADTTIGEISQLLTYVESNLNKFKCEAIMSSLAVVSEDIIHLKYKVLKKRMKLASVAAAAIAATPIPGIDVAANIGLLVEEINHYIDFFGLSKKKMAALTSFERSSLKCNKILFPGADMAVFVISRLGFYATIMIAENVLDIFLPFVGSLISAATSGAITYTFLKSILKDIKGDAIVVHQHIVKQQSSIRL